MAGGFINFFGGGVGISTGFALGNNQLGLSVNLNTELAPIGGQTFRTVPLPNFRPAIYGLAIRGSFGSLIGGFTFPLSPSSLRKDYAAMSNIYDVAGQPQQGGVNRVLDSYGISPVTFIIEGTTGWQYHSTDGYSQTGLQAIAALEQFFFQYAQINAANAGSNQPLYTMEFYDHFRGDYWQVEPVGPQGAHIVNNRPLLVYYSYRLAGINNLTNPITPEYDQVGNILSGQQQPNPNTAGGIIDAGTNANQSDFPNTTPAPNTVSTTITEMTPLGGTSSDFSAAPEGLQQTLDAVPQSSANIQQNYQGVTPTTNDILLQNLGP